MKKFQINDHVFFWTAYVPFNEGIVRNSLTTHGGLLTIEGMGDTHGTQTIAVSNCFHTAEELNAYNQQTSDAQVLEYRASISTVSDLVRFMYDHTVSKAEEYTDWEARAAACDAAKELLGLDLSIEE